MQQQQGCSWPKIQATAFDLAAPALAQDRLKIGRHDSRRMSGGYMLHKSVNDAVAPSPLAGDTLSCRGICVAHTNHGGCHELSEKSSFRCGQMADKSSSQAMNVMFPG
jgi:hypothetical protein